MVEVWGVTTQSNGKFVSLATLDQGAEAAIQERNKVPSVIDFATTNVTAIRVRLQAFDNIPKGHHRAGDKARTYVDELVVE
jgi:hexosaminidase